LKKISSHHTATRKFAKRVNTKFSTYFFYSSLLFTSQLHNHEIL